MTTTVARPGVPRRTPMTGAHRESAGARPRPGPVGTALASPRGIASLVLVGLVLRVWQYAAGVPFGIDETALARNVIALPTRDLLTLPLAFDQVAPRGFLLLQKIAVVTLGDGEHALRLVPFVAGIAALVLFAFLARRTLEGLAVPFAVAAFAIATPLVRYGAEVKQYGVDAFATVALLLVARELRERDASRRRLLAMGLAGLLLSLVSHASAIVMAGIGLAFAVEWLRDRDPRLGRALLVTMPVWAAAALGAVLAGEQSMMPGTREFMREFWRSGFMPMPPRALADALWLPGRLVSPFADPWALDWRPAPLFVAVAIAGTAALWRTRRDVALLLVGPVVVTLLAAAARQYPFEGWLIVFLLPVVLLLVAQGAEWVRTTLDGRLRQAGGVAMAALLVPPVLALAVARMPIVVEPHRDALAWLQGRRQPGDAVYVLHALQSPTLHYAARYGMGPGDWYVGGCDRDDTRAFLRDVDRLRGRPRAWVMLGGRPSFRTARDAIRGYLGTIGVRRDSTAFRSSIFGPELVELYDLSDSLRLGTADAETFPVAPMPTDPAPGCRDWSGDPREIVRGG